MSETLAAPVSETPTTPSVDAPGPVVGTTSPEPAAPSTASVPAADSPAPETAPPTEAPSDKPPSSLLSEAKSEETKPAEEAKPEEPKAEAEPAKPETPLPTYEAFKIPEGITVDDAQMGAFTGILGELENKLAADPASAHAVMQEMGQRMLDLYATETAEAAQRMSRLQHDTWVRTREGWVSDFRADPEIGGNRQNTTIQRCGALLELYGRSVGADREGALRDVFSMTGSGDHPEVLRFMNWLADYAVEKPRVVAALAPRAPQPGTRAERLYRNSLPGAA